MRPLVGPVPDPAERACSALRRCPRASLTLGAAEHADPRPVADAAPTPRAAEHSVALVHALAGTADLRLVAPTAAFAGVPSEGLRARLEVFDVVVGGAADGWCRRLVVVEGHLTLPDAPAQRRAATDIARDLADPALLDVGTAAGLARLRAERIVLTDHEGVTDVAVDDLATSGPDPFADIEGHWLAHLNDPRCAVVGRIAMRLGRCAPARRPLLVGIDRAGVDLEVTGRDGLAHVHRLPFAEECVGVEQLGRQIRLLAGCPRSAAPLAARSDVGSGRNRP